MTDNKQPPSTKEEVSDVLSSIRRLVSDELRGQDKDNSVDTSGMLTLENTIDSEDPASGSPAPLVLSETVGSDKVIPPLSTKETAEPRIGPETLDLARISEESNDPPLTSMPIRGASHLPKPIGPVADLETGASEPDAPLPLPKEGIANIQGMPPESKLGTMKKDDNISPFVLASLEKRQTEAQVTERIETAAEEPSEASAKPAFVNPFARGRKTTEDAAETSEELQNSDAKQANPDIDAEIAEALNAAEINLEPDPEFDSFQNAEKAFEELAKAAETVKKQSSLSGVQSVIEEAGFKMSGKELPELKKEAPVKKASVTPLEPVKAADDPEISVVGPKNPVHEPKMEPVAVDTAAGAVVPGVALPDPEPEQQAPFFDEAELRAIVTDIVREELSGELGEKLSRNIRKIIRRQVAIALSEDEGSSGILDD